MNQNPFAQLETAGMEEAKDTLGGGGFIVDSDAYDGTIKLAYQGFSKDNAMFLEVHVDLDNGKTFRERLWTTSGDAKGRKPYYHPKGDTTKKVPLPGYTTANDICLLATGQDLGSQTVEEKVVKLYNYDEKMEIPTKVPAFTELHGKRVTLGILKNIVDKNVQDASGAYVPSGETREENTINKVFHAETKKTVSEYVAKAEEAAFYPAWVDKNKGNTINRAKGAEGKAGTPGKPGGAKPTGAAGSPGKSLFG